MNTTSSDYDARRNQEHSRYGGNEPSLRIRGGAPLHPRPLTPCSGMQKRLR